MKRLILYFLLVISSLASFAYDAYVDGIYYNLNSSKQTATVTYETSNYCSYTGSVVIHETFTYNDVEYRVTSIGSSAFRSCSFLASVTIPNSVTSIGSSAFSSCSALISITIPNSVASIGREAFWGCSSLSSVIIPNSITSIENHTFKGCSSLTSVTIPYSVRSIGINPFADCSSLTSLKVEEENPYYCSENDVIFNKAKSELISCAGAKQGEYTIPNSVSIIGERAFYGCSSLTSVTIPNTVTSISSSAFSRCSSLTSVTIPNSVTSIGQYAFLSCSNLKSVYIDDLEAWCKIDFYDGGNPLYSGHGKLYINNELVTDLIIPSSITKVNHYAFKGCSSITSVTIPNSVTSIGTMAFYACM